MEFCHCKAPSILWNLKCQVSLSSATFSTVLETSPLGTGHQVNLPELRMCHNHTVPIALEKRINSDNRTASAEQDLYRKWRRKKIDKRKLCSLFNWYSMILILTTSLPKDIVPQGCANTTAPLSWDEYNYTLFSCSSLTFPCAVV